jgi:uncharacterized protein (TIGR04222 family)
MLDVHPALQLGGLTAAWLTLVVAAVVLAVRGRRKLLANRLPLDAPADLDTYGLACLAGGAGRLRDVALTRLFACGALRFGSTRSAPIVGDEVPANLHPVEVTIRRAALERPRKWLHVCHEVSLQLARPYREDLVRQDLTVDPARGWLLAPASFAWSLALALSILGIIALAPDGRTLSDGTPAEVAVVVAGLGFCGCCYGLVVTAATLFRNRRGDHVLAKAQEEAVRLSPKYRRAWSGLAPEELMRAVALFGLGSWASQTPLAPLQAALYPPPPPSSGG